MTEQLIIILEKWGALDWSGLLVLAPVFFIFAALLPVPRTALCLGSGAIFGLSAIPIIVPSTTLGAVVAFLLARYLFAEPLRRLAYRSIKLRIILRAIDDEGWRVVGLMRFAGPVPNFLQNLMFGLTGSGFGRSPRRPSSARYHRFAFTFTLALWGKNARRACARPD